jgi:hypothetical protein
MSSPLILRESTHERGKVGFMVFVIKPSHAIPGERISSKDQGSHL